MNRVAASSFGLCILIGAVLLIVATPLHFCLATTTVTVSPSSWTLGDPSAIVMIQADAAASGNELVFDVYTDADGDGVMDAEDGRFMSFEIADGAEPYLGNEIYWHDQDGEANSSVTATLTAFGYWEDSWFSGDFILKVTDEDSSTATTTFTAEQDSSYPCVVKGEVQLGGSPLAGAFVMVMDMAEDEDVALAMGDAEGKFEIRVEFPGEYGVYAMQLGAVTKLMEGSGQVVEVKEGENQVAQPLVLFPGNRSISGRVFASDTGEGFAGVLVFAEAEGLLSLTVTDEDGDYSLAVVDGLWENVGVEQAQFLRLGYLAAAERSVTVSGGDVEGVGFLCPRPTTLITGTVKDADTQEGLPGIVVDVEESENNGDEGLELFTYTLEEGDYKIGVVEGEWWVGLDEQDVVGMGYARPPWQLITAPGSGTVSGIDFLLQKAGTITGHVCEDDGVTPIEEARVEAFKFGTWNWVTATETEPDGSYILSVASGTYRLRVLDVEGFLDENYLDALNWEDATPVVVTAPNETSGIDFVLDRAGYITGYVYEDDGVTPLEGIHMEALVFGDWLWVTSDETGPDGSYSLAVPTGTYAVSAWPSQDWMWQYYEHVESNDDATPVGAVAGETMPGIDFVLEPAAKISGHVYQENGATPIAGARVDAYDIASDKGYGGPETGADGSFSITVPTGSYRLWADADGWAAEYYDGAYLSADATVITLGDHEDRTGIDFTLVEESAKIRGHVYQDDGISPLWGVQVCAQDYATGAYMGQTDTEGDGSYELKVPPGTFTVFAWTHHWSLQYYDHVWRMGEATPLVLGDDGVVENIDFELSWVPLVVYEVNKSSVHAGGVEVQWWWIPGMLYRVYWTDEMRAGDTIWHEVPDPYPDIVQEGTNGGYMTWTDKGTSPGMGGLAPGDPRVRERFYRIQEEER